MNSFVTAAVAVVNFNVPIQPVIPVPVTRRIPAPIPVVIQLPTKMPVLPEFHRELPGVKGAPESLQLPGVITRENLDRAFDGHVRGAVLY